MEIEWHSLLFGSVIGTILGGIVSFLITKWGIKQSFRQEEQMRDEENQKRWKRWRDSRPSLSGRYFDFPKNADLIYEIRDWASTVRSALEADGTPSGLTRALTESERRIHLSSIAAFLTFHEFPEELERDILDLYIQTEYVSETVQDYISAPDQCEREIIRLMAETIQQEANALLQRATKSKSDSDQIPTGITSSMKRR